MKNNWLKMYDKFGLILRIETVINQPARILGLPPRPSRRDAAAWSGTP